MTSDLRKDGSLSRKHVEPRTKKTQYLTLLLNIRRGTFGEERLERNIPGETYLTLQNLFDFVAQPKGALRLDEKVLSRCDFWMNTRLSTRLKIVHLFWATELQCQKPKHLPPPPNFPVRKDLQNALVGSKLRKDGSNSRNHVFRIGFRNKKCWAEAAQREKKKWVSKSN